MYKRVRGRRKGTEIKVIDVGVLVVDGFPRGQDEFEQIKEFMLAGGANRPFQMVDNLTTVHEKQRKGLTLGSMLEQVRSKDDLRVLATNGQISVYALRIPHPERAELQEYFNITDAYLNLVVVVGPHCAPVILKDSSLNEGYNWREEIPEKQVDGHYHNFFEELGRETSIERFTSSYPVPADRSGIFCGLNDEVNNSSAGHFWFISNSGERIASPRCNWINIGESGRLPSGEMVFVIHDNFTRGYDNCMTFDPETHQFIEVPDSRADSVDYYHWEDELGFIYKRNHGQYSELDMIDRQGQVTTLRLPPGIRIRWLNSVNTDRNFASFVINSYSNNQSLIRIDNTPDRILIMKSGNELVAGYALLEDVSRLESDERAFKYDLQTNIIQSTLADPYSLESVFTILTYEPPASENNGNIGMWIRREPVITDSPIRKAKKMDLMPIIYRQMTALPDVLAILPAQPDKSALIHPTRRIDNLHSQISSIVTPIFDLSSSSARGVSINFQDYLGLKPALTRVINANMTLLRERLSRLGMEGAIQSDEAREFTARLTLLNGILQGLPD